jgi:transcriptional regulator with XRE-family HTH domain
MDDGGKPVPRTELEPVCIALARVIRRRREARGLSLGGLAALTQLTRQMLSFVETGRRVPSIDTVARISRALGVPCSRLLAEAEGMECGGISQ